MIKKIETLLLIVIATLLTSCASTGPYSIVGKYQTKTQSKLFVNEDIYKNNNIKFWGYHIPYTYRENISHKSFNNKGSKAKILYSEINNKLYILYKGKGNVDGDMGAYLIGIDHDSLLFKSKYERGPDGVRGGKDIFSPVGIQQEIVNQKYLAFVSKMDDRYAYARENNFIAFIVDYLSLKEVNCSKIGLLCKINYEQQGLSNYSTLTFEIIDYREQIKEFELALDNGDFLQASTIFIPKHLVNREKLINVVKTTTKQKDIQILSDLVNSSNYGFAKNSLNNQQEFSSFTKDYNIATDGGLATKKSFLTKHISLSNKGHCAIVNSSTLNIRREPDTASRKIGIYMQGDLICPLNKNSGWTQTNKGWVSSKYLSKGNFTLYSTQYKAIAEQVDMLEYSIVKNKNTIDSYSKYINQPRVIKYEKLAINELIKLYRQKADFNSYMEIYKLNSDSSVLTLAKKYILNSKNKINVSSSLVDIYFNNAVLHKNKIPEFLQILSKMNGINSNNYSSRMLKLPSISNNFTPNNYLNSIEYKYILSNLIPDVSVSYQHEYIELLLDYSDFRVRIKEDADCTFKKSESGVRDRGFLESVLSLNLNNKESYSYDVYSCQLGNSELTQVKNMLKRINSYRSKDGVSKLTSTWNANKSTGSYTYSESNSSYTNTTSNSTSSENKSAYLSQDGVWIKLSCSDGTERTIRDCKDGYYEAGSTGFTGCHHKGRNKAAAFVCESYGGFN